ncbi:MAG TPA: YbaB/EbfC family nucleoid-associated protein, partial [Oligoflexia bacterium]|nr:YbaB/EbfC family nucleoid-associated protein [Oligoflexia bacterium]
MGKNPLQGGFGNFMKQAQQMQQRIQRAQSEVAEKTAEGSAGGGVVKVVANGKQEILSVTINKEAVNPDDVEMLQDMV